MSSWTMLTLIFKSFVVGNQPILSVVYPSSLATVLLWQSLISSTCILQNGSFEYVNVVKLIFCSWAEIFRIDQLVRNFFLTG